MTGMTVLFALAAMHSRGSSGLWVHDWSTPASAWWGYGAMGGSLFGHEDVVFISKTYRIVVLSLCATPQMNTSVSDGIMNVSARLKALNPAIKVLQYFNMNQWPCYLPTDPAYAEFLRHPEWWLRDDYGNVLRTNGSGSTSHLPPIPPPTGQSLAKSWLPQWKQDTRVLIATPNPGDHHRGRMRAVPV